MAAEAPIGTTKMDGKRDALAWGERRSVNDLSFGVAMENSHVDEVMCRMQGTSKKTAIMRFGPLSMRMGVAGTPPLNPHLAKRECKLGD